MMKQTNLSEKELDKLLAGSKKVRQAIALQIISDFYKRGHYPKEMIDFLWGDTR